MKFAPLRALMAVSLVANLVLVVNVASRFADRWASERRARELASSGQAGKSAESEFVRLPSDTWDQLAAGDDHLLAARLFAAGFPRNVARAMVSARGQERLADLQKIVADARINTPFWRRHLRWTHGDQKIRAAERALSRERTAIMRQLWDDLDDRHESTLRMHRFHYGNLSDDSLLAVERAREETMHQRMEIEERAGGVFFRDELEQLSQLKRDETEAVAKVLTPAEFGEFNRGRNPTSNRIRSDRRIFEPTTEELPALIEVQQPFDEHYRNLKVLSLAQAQERAAARAEMNRQTEALLGTERFAAYLNAIEKDWLKAGRFTLAHQLPPSATEQILAIEADIKTRSGHGDYLPLIRREAHRAALFDEANERLTAALGAENVAAYRDGPGNWFLRLATPLTTP